MKTFKIDYPPGPESILTNEICQVCVGPAKQYEYIILSTHDGKTGAYQQQAIVCSYRCAEMYVLQNM